MKLEIKNTAETAPFTEQVCKDLLNKLVEVRNEILSRYLASDKNTQECIFDFVNEIKSDLDSVAWGVVSISQFETIQSQYFEFRNNSKD